ncbi:hypothetical protein L7F22_039242 [Adiantum nelumboides]|nr:hypothetical protein [Adiantum nelumboides]
MMRSNVVLPLVVALCLLTLTKAVPCHKAALQNIDTEDKSYLKEWRDVPRNERHKYQPYTIQDEHAIHATDLDDGDGRGAPHMPGWKDPRKKGGSMLDLVGNGLREPINAIISGHSDPYVLSDAGLRDYVRTIGFSFECLDLHLGGLQRANLGDGQGWLTEMFEFRQTESWGAPGRWIGACWETFRGGNHFRVWKQNGTHADTGAWFLAVSLEKDLRHHHTIDDDGYNRGRDLLVEAAQLGGRWKIWKWKAKVQYEDDLLAAGRRGINHDIDQDGRVAILTVHRVIEIGMFSIPLNPSWIRLPGQLYTQFTSFFTPIFHLMRWLVSVNVGWL